jgi:hypothetical protein
MRTGRHRRGAINVGSIELVEPGAPYLGRALHARSLAEETGGGGALPSRRVPFPPINLGALVGSLASVVRHRKRHDRNPADRDLPGGPDDVVAG